MKRNNLEIYSEGADEWWKEGGTFSPLSGFVEPPKDAAALAAAFEKLYRDPNLRARMGHAARARIATDFRNEETVKKTIRLYQELIP